MKKGNLNDTSDLGERSWCADVDLSKVSFFSGGSGHWHHNEKVFRDFFAKSKWVLELAKGIKRAAPTSYRQNADVLFHATCLGLQLLGFSYSREKYVSADSKKCLNFWGAMGEMAGMCGDSDAASWVVGIFESWVDGYEEGYESLGMVKDEARRLIEKAPPSVREFVREKVNLKIQKLEDEDGAGSNPAPAPSPLLD